MDRSDAHREDIRGGVRLMVYDLHGIVRVDVAERAIQSRDDVNSFARQITDLINNNAHPRILLSFEEVETISSMMVGQLVALSKQAKAKNGQISILHARGEVRSVMKVTRIDQMIKVYDDLETALKSFKQRSWMRFFRR